MFASDDKIHSFERVQYSDIALLCEVQAYPIATIRYDKSFQKMAIANINSLQNIFNYLSLIFLINLTIHIAI